MKIVVMALDLNTTGASKCAVGSGALDASTTGNNNILGNWVL